MAYEHGSPDDDPDQKYISFLLKRSENSIEPSISLDRGAYYEGQMISASHSYSAVWISYGLFESPSIADADREMWRYLQAYICETPETRKPLYYYNTWGMQRDESLRGNDIRGILTEERVNQEISYAAQLGLNLFVLDDGWQETWGDWTVHNGRFPQGLRFYVDAVKSKGILPGLWIAPLATDSGAAVTRNT
jgi:hypothetical protein